ncbi:MAG: RibD family protein [Candidatus Xiphinematobacter sp.]|nr:MAG: RibD family protein [Candidatus Xiphinematobacter sp.]
MTEIRNQANHKIVCFHTRRLAGSAAVEFSVDLLPDLTNTSSHVMKQHQNSFWPKVIVNFSMSADGKVSVRNWMPSGFGSAVDRRRMQEIRARGDAIMVGRRTAEVDQMQMGISLPDLRAGRQAAGKSAEPLRVLVSARGPLDPKMKVFLEMRAPLLVFTAYNLPLPVRSTFPEGVIINALTGKSFSLSAILRVLRSQYHVRTLVCEGGPTLLRALLEVDAISEVNLTIEPLVFGGCRAPTLSGLLNRFLSHPIPFRLESIAVRESACFVRYVRKRQHQKMMVNRAMPPA